MSLLTRNPEPFDPLDAEAGQQAAAEDKLEVIAKYVRRCVLCGLWKNRLHAVPGEGDAAARLLIVGEGPGKTEDELGRPFVGRSGELLNEILDAASIPRQAAFITNIVKCRSADMVAGRLQNRAPHSQEVNACRPYLVRQLEVIRPQVIVCLGASAAKGVIDVSFNLSQQRGKWFEGPFGSKIVATFHPAFILRGGGVGLSADALKQLTWQDFNRVSHSL